MSVSWFISAAAGSVPCDSAAWTLLQSGSGSSFLLIILMSWNIRLTFHAVLAWASVVNVWFWWDTDFLLLVEVAPDSV